MDEETQYQDTESLDETGDGEDQAIDTPDELSQAKADAAKYRAIAERKEKQLEKALKSLKDEPELKPRKAEGLTEIEELNFKIDHPELRPHLDIIKDIAKINGTSLEDAMSNETVKKVLQAEQREKGVSIINSNNRIATPRSETIKDKNKVIEIAQREPGRAEDALAGYLMGLKE